MSTSIPIQILLDIVISLIGYSDNFWIRYAFLPGYVLQKGKIMEL